MQCLDKIEIFIYIKCIIRVFNFFVFLHLNQRNVALSFQSNQIKTKNTFFHEKMPIFSRKIFLLFIFKFFFCLDSEFSIFSDKWSRAHVFYTIKLKLENDRWKFNWLSWFILSLKGFFLFKNRKSNKSDKETVFMKSKVKKKNEKRKNRKNHLGMLLFSNKIKIRKQSVIVRWFHKIIFFFSVFRLSFEKKKTKKHIFFHFILIYFLILCEWFVRLSYMSKYLYLYLYISSQLSNENDFLGIYFDLCTKN